MLRLKTKEGIVRHVEDLLRKAKTESERKVRCFFIAQLFYDVHEYDEVINYAKEYISLKNNSSSAYKLLGQAFEALNQFDKAITSFEKCLQYDDSQHELLLKLCELYCQPDITLDHIKAKKILEQTEKYFPYHSSVDKLRERIMHDHSTLNKDEYEKLLAAEIKKTPNDPKYRINLMELYLKSGRTEFAYRSCSEIENKRLFADKIEWYVCLDNVYQSFYDNYSVQCDSEFFINHLHCLDCMCALSYSTDVGINEISDPVIKMDKVLYQVSHKFNTDEYKCAIDHYSAQLAFHIAMIIALRTKAKSDYTSGLQYKQIWYEIKNEIGALLLFSIKHGTPKLSFCKSKEKFKGHELRFNNDRLRYVQVYYTFQSLAQVNNQGVKQFFDCIGYFTAGNWREGVYINLHNKPHVDTSKSYFVNSDYYQNVPLKEPKDTQIWDLLKSFDFAYGTKLHHMIWIGLRTMENANDPLSMKINPNLHLSAFCNLNVESSNLSNISLESLSQLDMDSYLYLLIFCKALQIKLKGDDQQVVLPSCITSKLHMESENQFWVNALAMAHDLSKDQEGKSPRAMKGAEISESGRLQMKTILEQVRGYLLPLPLTVNLARTFTSRTDIKSPVLNPCEKRAFHLWHSVIEKIEFLKKKIPSWKVKNEFFNFDVGSYSKFELKSIKNEAAYFIGSYFFKNFEQERALFWLEQVDTSRSLYSQALIHETLALKECEQSSDSCNQDARVVQNINSEKCYTLLVKSLQTMESDGESDSPLAKEVKDKLKIWSRESNVNRSPLLSRNCDDIDDISSRYMANQEKSDLITSTPHRVSKPNAGNINGSITVGSQELGEFLSTYKNQIKLEGLENSYKLLSERIEIFQLTIGNRLDGLVERIDRKFDKMESSLKSYFNDLKKEIKQKPDLYNMLEEDDYSPDAEVLNYPNYYQNAVQRSSAAGLIQGAAYAGAAAATALPPPAPTYFPPNQLYQGGVPFYGQTVPFPTEPQMADYLRTLATQRGNALGNLPTVTAIHHASLLPANLPQVPAAPSSSGSKHQVQTQAPNNVVITTSDSLPTSVPTTAPTLFVNIPPEHRLGSNPVTVTTCVSTPVVTVPATSAPHKFQIPMPSNFKLVEKAPLDDADDMELEATLDVSKDSDGITHLEHDPLPNFKPVIPLPDEVEIRTGEENETVVFDCRAKLFRLINQEWKERGLGQLKVLKSNEELPRFRILMRREQVHKVCANHFVTSDMKLVKASGNDKSYIWWAHDFADEKVEVEKFLVRFKTVEDGELFKEKFEEGNKAAEKILASSLDKSKPLIKPPKLNVAATPADSPAEDNKITVGGFTFTSQPKIIEAKDSEIKKVEDKKTARPFASFNFGSTTKNDKQPLSFGFTPKPVGLNETKTELVKTESSSKLLELLKPDAGSWECSGCYSRNVASSKVCVACQTPAPNADKVQTPASSDVVKKDSTLPSLSSLFKKPPGTWSCEECLVQNNSELSSCVACGTVKPGCAPPQKFIETTTTFTFGIPSSTVSTTPPTTTQVQSVFGQSTVDSAKTQSLPSNAGIFTFGMPAVQTSTDFTFGSAKFNFTMATPTKGDDVKSPQVTPKNSHKSDAEDTDNEQHDEDHDHTEGIYFQPVIEMPDKIEVKTGEEDEMALYSQRSKLYRFDSETKEWKERGVGDVKILKHKVSGRIRLLMRREPVMKLCLNHYLTPELEIKAKDPKSWMWCAQDFSEGEQILEKFCIRFKTPDIAQEFKKNFDSAKVDKVSSGKIDKVSSAEVDTSDEVVFISETKVVSDKLREQAIALKLPENFYKYLNMPDCPGCRGCEKDSSDEIVKISIPKISTDSTIKPTSFAANVTSGEPLYFGSKASSSPDLGSLTPSQGIMAGKSIFGNSLIKPSILEGNKGEGDKVSTFSFTPSKGQTNQETKESQISTFSFSRVPTAQPAFSFSSQNSIFGSPLNTLTQNVSVITSPADSSFKSAVDSSGTILNSIFGTSLNTLSQNVSVSTSSPVDSSGTILNSFLSSPPVEKPEMTLSATPVFGSKNVQPPPTQSGITLFGSSADLEKATPIFGAAKDNQNTVKVDASEGKTDSVPLMFLSKDEGLSFGALASQADPKNTFAGDNTSFKWEGAGTKLFKGKADETPKSLKEEDADDDDKNESNDKDDHDPYFEPIVPLPDKVDLKTGEEDEDAVFSQRAKLYRMDQDTKEWKERGVGTMKVLKHRETSSHRLLMRREQVHKIVCNHRISDDIKLTPHSSSDSIFCWGAMNMSQDETEPSQELLCVKFKNRDIALQFKEAFESGKPNSSPKQ